MAATEILATGTTVATSSVITLASGEGTNVSVFAASGVGIPYSAVFEVKILNSNATHTLFKRLTGGEFTTHINGPGAFYVDRLATGGISLGVDRN